MTPLADTLDELAVRVEEAQGADRELDRDIAVLVFGLKPEPRWPGSLTNGIRTIDWRANQALGPVPATEPEDMGSFVGWTNFDIPPFTASLDAAMQLVPEGWNWSWYGLIRRAFVLRPGVHDDSFGGRGTAPALALTAASLRARASLIRREG